MSVRRFLSKKTMFVALPIMAILLLGGVTLAQPGKSKDESTEMEKTSRVVKEQPVESPKTTEQAQPTVAVSVPQAQPASEPAPATRPSSPLYGPDPDNPGFYTVFDRRAVMTAAGIQESQQGYAEEYIALWSGWRYKEDGSKALCYPKRREVQQFYSNPVEHLTYCNRIVNAPNQNWESRLVQLKTDMQNGSGYLP